MWEKDLFHEYCLEKNPTGFSYGMFMNCISLTILWASQVVLKNPLANVGDGREAGSILGSGRFPGGGYSNPLQYSCLENPMDRGVWWVIVHGVTDSRHNWVTNTFTFLSAPFWNRVYFSILLLSPCFGPTKLGGTHVQSEALNVFAQLDLLAWASAIWWKRMCPEKLLIPGWEDTWNRPDADSQPEAEPSQLSPSPTSERNKCCRPPRFWGHFLCSFTAVVAD